jgi:hypothetical protein
MAESRDLPGWPKKKLVTQVRRQLASFGIRPSIPSLWRETWEWAHQITNSYVFPRWPLASEIAAQYVLLLLVEMQSHHALKLPYRAAEQQPPSIRHKDGNEDRCLGYLMNFSGHGVYDASLGKVEVTPEQADTHNRLLDEALLKGLDENCQVGQGGSFYVGRHEGRTVVRTFLGTLVSADVSVNGRSLTFRRNAKTFRGRLSKQHDLFHFRRVA